MAFIETPRFPADISYGSSGGPEYRTSIVELLSGYEVRNKDWLHPRARYTITQDVKSPAQMYTLLKFFNSVAHGRFNSFRFKDWADYIVLITEGLLDAGVGSGIPAYQFYKRYASDSETYDRKIAKLVSGTVTVYRDAAPVTFGAGAGEVALNYNTGLATFVADASASITGHTPGASHIFTTTADLSMLGVGDKVYITGTTGTAATLLNNLAHTITDKTGTYTWTLGTVTTGLTASGGTAAAYPQADEALTFGAEFDTPVRFDTDHFDSTIDSFGTRSWVDVPIIEVRV
jgi:uncharacterized protein (TIGR02217 family)